MAARVENAAGSYSPYGSYYSGSDVSYSVTRTSTINVPSGLSNSALLVLGCGNATGPAGGGPYTCSFDVWANGLGTTDSNGYTNAYNFVDFESEWDCHEGVAFAYYKNPSAGTITFGGTTFGYKASSSVMTVCVTEIYAVVVSNVDLDSFDYKTKYGTASSKSWTIGNEFATAKEGDVGFLNVSPMATPWLNDGSIVQPYQPYYYYRAVGGVLTSSSDAFAFSASNDSRYSKGYGAFLTLLPGLPDPSPTFYTPLHIFG